MNADNIFFDKYNMEETVNDVYKFDKENFVLLLEFFIDMQLSQNHIYATHFGLMACQQQYNIAFGHLQK